MGVLLLLLFADAHLPQSTQTLLLGYAAAIPGDAFNAAVGPAPPLLIGKVVQVLWRERWIETDDDWIPALADD